MRRHAVTQFESAPAAQAPLGDPEGFGPGADDSRPALAFG
jgi:hypothetical protein